MTPTDLIAAGYAKHESEREGATALYQKRFTRETPEGEITLYFISIDHYRDIFDRLPGLHPGYEWQVEATLYLPEGRAARITYAWDLDLERIESFFSFAYEVLGCIPDPHN